MCIALLLSNFFVAGEVLYIPFDVTVTGNTGKLYSFVC